MGTRMRALNILAAVLVIYVGTFIVVHGIVVHGSLRFSRKAAPAVRWHYSDNRSLEFVGFYGFWPLRHIAYHVAPGLVSRHKSELVYPRIDQIGNAVL